ncbi:uncharacterized protein LOC126738981 [Anthonomus grandis grandis]|uniref:uncharacterized protein LOC126738981 n=1 Tax=Anthonomus grandis grandis TaxID=2921223 RepID=UPI002166BCD3|nr:uncharacterized protein LOC126738981 [Anthonomus grandis grandis]
MAAERDNNLKIVIEVEKFPCLYNFKRSDYSRKDITEKAWHEISKETKFSDQECKERWKNIRSAFVRSLKPAPSGSSAKSKKPYYLHDYLLFILPYIKPINTTKSPGNIEGPPNPSETQVALQVDETAANNHEDEESPAPSEVIFNNNSEREDSVPITSKSAKNPQYNTTGKKNMYNNLDKSFLEYLQNKKKKLAPTDDNETARKYFLLSLLPDIKTLTDDQMRHFKLEVLHLIDNIKKSSGPSTITTPLSSTGSNNYP